MVKFTCEFEKNCLPFLDVLVEHTNLGFLTSIEHKPTFTGLYTCWGSFCPLKNKINQIKTLVHHALMIYSKSKPNDELNFFKTTLSKNRYPEDKIPSTIRYKCMQFSANTKFGPEKCPVYLKLPWIGKAFIQLIEQIKRTISCYFNVVNL